MKVKNIYITEADKSELLELIGAVRLAEEKRNGSLRELEGELERAKIVKPEEIAADVVTMNSRVRVTNAANNKELVYEIVYPDEADIDEGKISVLAPIGTALLGYKAGDTVVWKAPNGDKKFVIEQIVYQPEANGVFAQ